MTGTTMHVFILCWICGIGGHLTAGRAWAAEGGIQRTKDASIGVKENTGGKLELVAIAFDFGTIKQGEKVSHEFVFTNIGDAALEITDVEASCSCTTIGDWTQRVEPGRRGVIPIRFDSDGLSGKVYRTVTVVSNDSRQTKITLRIVGDVWTPFSLSPSQVSFLVSRDSSSTQIKKVRIVSRLPGAVSLLASEGGDANFRAQIEELIPTKEFEVQITAVPPFLSTTSARFTITTSSAEAPTISVMARIVVQ